MDNASKALLMAGGILIAIAIISVSLYIYSSAQGVAKTSDDMISASAVASFNRYYLSFGSKINPIDVLNICNRVDDDNDKYASKTSVHKIDLTVNKNLIISFRDTADGVKTMKNLTDSR